MCPLLSSSKALMKCWVEQSHEGISKPLTSYFSFSSILQPIRLNPDIYSDLLSHHLDLYLIFLTCTYGSTYHLALSTAAKLLQSCLTLCNPIDSTRPPCPWGSPGKNTGVGCHFLLQYMKLKSESEVAQSCLTLSDPMDYSLPGSSVPGILQARVLEWAAIAFSTCHLRG